MGAGDATGRHELSGMALEQVPGLKCLGLRFGFLFLSTPMLASPPCPVLQGTCMVYIFVLSVLFSTHYLGVTEGCGTWGGG